MTSPPRKRPALGRGLGALLPENKSTTSPASSTNPSAKPTGSPKLIPVDRLAPNPGQPRKQFDTQQLQELASSLRNQGMIQPIIVTPLPLQSERYEILAGERRWRAAQLAQMSEVPVFIRETPEHKRLEIALVENIQRSDLNPLEEAHAYQRLMDEHRYTQEQLATRVGKDRSTVANCLRLLRLPEKIQRLVREQQLSMGHARTLLGLPDESTMNELGQLVIQRKLSVRALESEVKRRTKTEASPPEPEPDDNQKRRAIIVDDLETRLRGSLGVRVRLRTGKQPDGPGKIEIPYSDLDELDRLLHTLLESTPR